MATVLGNIALLFDLNSPRASIPDRKTRPSLLDVVSSLTKREPQFTSYYAAPGSKSFEMDGDARSHRAVVARGKDNSKVNGVDFDAGSSDEDSNGNGNGYDEDEEEFDWEKEMRRRVKEMEEMKELERKAEELQTRAEEEGGEGEVGEETEEEKKMRVRKELEKVRLDRSQVILI